MGGGNPEESGTNQDRIDRAISGVLVRLVSGVLARPGQVAWAIVGLTVLLGAYAATNLGVNSDNMSIVSDRLPTRQEFEYFAERFPNLNAATFVVVDGETPELAREATEKLSARLGEQKELFPEVYAAGGGPFFERYGLLFRTPDELDEFATEITRFQPLIAELEAAPRLATMSSLIRQGLDRLGDDAGEAERWAVVLDRLGDATAQAFVEFPVAISWEEVLLRGSAVDPTRRHVLVVHADLDFRNVLAAGDALAAIRAAAEELELTPERGVRVRVTGNPVLNYEEMLGLAWDIGGAGLICFAVVAVILQFALRSARIVIAALATLVVGLVWTAALAAAAVGYLNLVSIAFAILFIGLGVDFAIHLGMAHADGLRAGRAPEEAMLEAVRQVGSALSICTVTTSTGFYVFVPTEYRGIAELGIIAGSGMFVILLLTFVFFPALLTSWLRVEPGGGLSGAVRFDRGRAAALDRVPGVVAVTALVLAVGSAALLPGSRFDPNVVSMRDPDTESVQAFSDLLAQSGVRSPWLANVVTPTLEEASGLAERLREHEVVGVAVTLGDYVPVEQEEKLEILADLSFLLEPTGAGGGDPPASVEDQVAALRDLDRFLDRPEIREHASPIGAATARLRERLSGFLTRLDAEPARAAETLAALERILLTGLPDQLARLRRALDPGELSVDQLPEGLRTRMVAADGTARIQIFPAQDLREYASFVRFVDGIREVTPKAIGVPVNLVDFGRLVVASFQQAVISALVLIALFLWVLWRRPGDILLALAPLVVSSLLTGAAMVVMDIAYNFVNVVVLPLLFGIGIDSGIHLVHRAHSRAPGEALLETTTARAVFYSALTTTISFGSLALSGHRGMQGLGLLLTAGMVFTVAANLVVLPALIELRSRAR